MLGTLVEARMSLYDFNTLYSCFGRLVVWAALVPVAIISIRFLLRKQWKRAVKLCAVFGAAALTLWGGEYLLYRIDHALYLSKIFDTNVGFGRPIYEYDSPRSFHGDGYSITVYQLPDSIRSRFASFDETLESDFPKKQGYRKDWHTQHWKVGPIPKEDLKYMRFACGFYSGGKPPAKLKNSVREFREALKSDPVYYSFFYSRLSDDKHDYWGDIDFFMIDPKTSRVYIINHNT